MYLQDDGSLLRAAKLPDSPKFRGGGQGGRIERIAWDGTVTWSYTLCDESALHHHDFEVLPNGNLLLIAWEGRSAAEAIAVGRDPEAVGDEGLWPDWILELKPTGDEGGEIVWEWHAWDHLIQDFDAQQANYGDVTAHPERIDINADHRDQPPLSEAERKRLAEVEEQMQALGYSGDDGEEEEVDDAVRGRRRRGGDWLHSNGIDYDPGRDLIVLSARSLSELWVIDHSTTTEQARGSTGGKYGKGGDLLWRWGNPRNYGAGKGRDRKLFVQHDPRFIPEGYPGAGNITVYNNGEGRPGERFSTVEEIELVLDEEGNFVRGERGILEPLEATWSHGHGEEQRFFSSFISGCERLPNGNTLITVGAEARVFEVTADGTVVWDFLVPFPAPREQEDGGAGPGERPEGGPPPGRGERTGRGDRGAPPGDGPPGDGPPGRGQGGPGGRGGGPGGMVASGLHRAGRVAHDHPGLKGKDLSPKETGEE